MNAKMEEEICTAPAEDLHQIVQRTIQEHPAVSGWLKSAKLGNSSQLEMDDVDPEKVEEEIEKITMMAYSSHETFSFEGASAGVQQRKSWVRRTRPKGKIENFAQLAHGRTGPHKQAQQTIQKYQAKSTMSLPLKRPRLSPLAARAALAAAVEPPQLGCTAALSIMAKKSFETLAEDKVSSAKRRRNTGHAASNFGIIKEDTCLKLMDVNEKIEQQQTEASGTKRKRGRPPLQGPQLKKVDTCLKERDVGQSMKKGGRILKRHHPLLGPKVDTCLREVDAAQKIEEQNTKVTATVKKRGCPDLSYHQPKPDLCPLQTDSSGNIEEQREKPTGGIRKRGRPPLGRSHHQVERHQLRMNVMPKVEEQMITTMAVDTTRDLEKNRKSPTGTVGKRGRPPLDPSHPKGKIHQVELNGGLKAEDNNEKDAGLVRNRNCFALDHPQARLDMQLRKMDAAPGREEQGSEIAELVWKRGDPVLYKPQPDQGLKVIGSHLNQWPVLPDNMSLNLFIDLPLDNTALTDWNRHTLKKKTQEQVEENLMANPIPPESSDRKKMAVKSTSDDSELNILSTEILRPKSRKKADRLVGKNKVDVKDDINCDPHAGAVGTLVGGKHTKANSRENPPTESLLDGEAKVSGNPSSLVTVVSGGEGMQHATGGWPVSSASINLAVDLVANVADGDSQSLAMHTNTISLHASRAGFGLGITGGLPSSVATEMLQSTHSSYKIQAVTGGITATQSSSSDVAAAVKRAPETIGEIETSGPHSTWGRAE